MSLSVRTQVHATFAALALALAANAFNPAAASAKSDLGDMVRIVSDHKSDAGRSDAKRSNAKISDDRKRDADKRSDRMEHDGRGAHAELRILDEVGRTVNYVARGHDVVIEQPHNRYVHYWCGDHGELFMVCRDQNAGTSVAFVLQAGIWTPLPPHGPGPKKRSFISLYDPQTNTTTTRIWPAGGGVITVVDQNDTRANYE
jgi:hypothetical protein